MQKWTVSAVLKVAQSRVLLRTVSSAGLGGAGLLSALFPFLSAHLSSVLTLTTLIGLCCGVAFASSYQLVSHFGVECSKSLTIGMYLQSLLEVEVCRLYGSLAFC